jgi:hypothetical protein
LQLPQLQQVLWTFSFIKVFAPFDYSALPKCPFAPSLLKTIHSSSEAFPSPALLSLNKGNRKKAFKPYFQNHNTFFKERLNFTRKSLLTRRLHFAEAGI